MKAQPAFFRFAVVATAAAVTACASSHASERGSPSSSSGLLKVTPLSGAVGSTVRFEGRHCQGSPEQKRTFLAADVFRRGADQPYGGLQVGWVKAARFSGTFTIPARAKPVQGVGGGPIRAGDRIQFSTSPQVCIARFFRVSGT